MFKKYFNACAASALLTGALMMPPAMADHLTTHTDANTDQAHAEFQRVLPQVQSGTVEPEALFSLIEQVPGEDVSQAVQAFVPYLTHQEDAYREQASSGMILAAVHCNDYTPFVLEQLEPLRDDPSHMVRKNLVNTMGYLAASTTEYYPQLLAFFEPMTSDSDPEVALFANSIVQTLNDLPEDRRQEIDADNATRPAKVCPALPQP